MADHRAKIDRQTTTPFLLRLFYRTGSFHRSEDFSPGQPLPSHVQIYTWQSCSLKELTHLLTSAIPSILPSPSVGTRLCFRLIYPDAATRYGPGRYLNKELGTVVIGPHSHEDEDAALGERLQGDAHKTLADARFMIGDYISCAVLPPLANGHVAPLPRTGPYSSRLPPSAPRENGFGQSYGSYVSRRPNGRFEPSRGSSNLPSGEWRRGDVPPGTSPAGPDRLSGFYRGSGGRGRGRW